MKASEKEDRQAPTEPSAVQERLAWQLAYGDDKRVAQALYDGKEIEEMHDTP